MKKILVLIFASLCITAYPQTIVDIAHYGTLVTVPDTGDYIPIYTGVPGHVAVGDLLKTVNQAAPTFANGFSTDTPIAIISKPEITCSTCDVGPLARDNNTGRVVIMPCNPCNRDSGMWRLDGNTALNANKKLGSKDSFDFSFISNNAERMRLTGNGKLGIGITNPTRLLDVECTTCAFGSAFKMADGSQGLDLVMTSDANGAASWQHILAHPQFTTVATSGDTVHMQAGKYYKVKSSGNVTGLKMEFPAGSPGDIIYVEYNVNSNTGAISYIGSSITQLAFPLSIYPNFRIYNCNSLSNWE